VPAIAAYGASKAALVGFTRSVAIEYAARNVQVNAIAPAYVDGQNKAEFFGSPGGLMFAHQFMPRQRPLPASAISGPVLFLASQLADHVTGHVLTVDGGYTVW
jgi:2-deoxy-D-gluconate 3-dehydrogenase